MRKYYIVETNGVGIDVRNVPDDYWFTNPIKKEGHKHKYMVEISYYDHWSGGRTLSSCVSCNINVYSYGRKEPFTISGWTFLPDKIEGKEATSSKFTGMELWFTCVSPEGERTEIYCNQRDAGLENIIRFYFRMIVIVSKCHTSIEAKSRMFNDPRCVVRYC